MKRLFNRIVFDANNLTFCFDNFRYTNLTLGFVDLLS